MPTRPTTPRRRPRRRARAAGALLVIAVLGNGRAEARTTPSNAAYLPVDAAAPLRSGRVVDLTRGIDRGAVERHLLRGARPTTSFALVGDVHADDGCVTPPISVPEGVLTTDELGNGSTVVTVPPEALASAPPVFWVRWRLLDGDTTAYVTGCTRIEVTS